MRRNVNDGDDNAVIDRGRERDRNDGAEPIGADAIAHGDHGDSNALVTSPASASAATAQLLDATIAVARSEADSGADGAAVTAASGTGTGTGTGTDADPAKDEPAPPPPMPYASLLVIYAIVSSDAVAQAIVTPFVADICRQRYGLADSEIGTVAGVLTGAGSFAVFFSSFFIGHISDQFGRKPLILIGLLATAVATLFFPVTTSFYVAILLRFVGGFLNANQALAKAVISDVTDHPESRAVAFAMQGAAFQAARSIGSAVGGLTVGIMIANYENRFFLPCLLGSLLNFCTFVAAWGLMPETIGKKKTTTAMTQKDLITAKEANASANSDNDDVAHRNKELAAIKVEMTEAVAAVHAARTNNADSDRDRDGDTDSNGSAAGTAAASAGLPLASPPPSEHDRASPPLSESHALVPLQAETAAISAAAPPTSPPTSVAPAAIVSSPHAVHTVTANADDDADAMVHGPGAPRPSCRDTMRHIIGDLKRGLSAVREDPLILKLFSVNLMNSFSNGSLLLLLSLYPALSVEYGGLGLGSTAIGIAFAWFGFAGMAFQLLFYKKLYKRCGGLWRTYYVGTIVLGVSSFLMPFSSMLYYSAGVNEATTPLTLIISIVLWAVMSTGFMICLPVVGAMLSNASDPARQGLVQGTAQSVASLSRGLGPMITGVIFSACVNLKFVGFPFWILCAANAGCLIVVHRMTPDEIQRVNAPRHLQPGASANADANAKPGEERASPAPSTSLGSLSSAGSADGTHDADVGGGKAADGATIAAAAPFEALNGAKTTVYDAATSRDVEHNELAVDPDAEHEHSVHDNGADIDDATTTMAIASVEPRTMTPPRPLSHSAVVFSTAAASGSFIAAAAIPADADADDLP